METPPPPPLHQPQQLPITFNRALVRLQPNLLPTFHSLKGEFNI
jgi:hypothetical protein